MKSAQPKDPEFDALPKKQRRIKVWRLAGIAVCAFAAIGACVIIWWITLASCLPEFVTMTFLTMGKETTTVARKLP